MRTLIVAIPLLLALGACSYFEDPGQAEGKVAAGTRFRSGYGTIDSVGILPNARRSSPAAAGGSAGNAPDPNRYRLFLRMDNSGFQTIDTDNPSFMAGEHIEVTPDGKILRISGTTLNRSPK